MSVAVAVAVSFFTFTRIALTLARFEEMNTAAGESSSSMGTRGAKEEDHAAMQLPPNRGKLTDSEEHE